MKLQLKRSNWTRPGPTTGSASATRWPTFKQWELPWPYVQVEMWPALSATGQQHLLLHQKHLLLLLHGQES